MKAKISRLAAEIMLASDEGAEPGDSDYGVAKSLLAHSKPGNVLEAGPYLWLEVAKDGYYLTDVDPDPDPYPEMREVFDALRRAYYR